MFRTYSPTISEEAWQASLPGIMGRPKQTEEQRREMSAIFINVTREIMETEGTDQVSIRKVASRVGCNSATIYLYFKNIDELITLASMGYLEEYYLDLAEALKQTHSSYEDYLTIWKTFGKHAFSNPQIFLQLFFTEHPMPLENIIERYYLTYPNKFPTVEYTYDEMLRMGDLYKRNLITLQPLADEGVIDKRDLNIINELSHSYFVILLQEMSAKSDIDLDGQLQRLLGGIQFLLNSHYQS